MASRNLATLSRAVTSLLLGAAAVLAACTPRNEPGKAARAPSAPAPSSSAAIGSAEAPAAATPPSAPVRGVSVLTLRFTNLPPVSAGHYEGWVTLGADRVSTGKFLVAGDGTLQSLGGVPISAFPMTRDIIEATQVLVTLEPDGDRDAAPSGITVLEGPVVRGRAILSFPVSTSGFGGSVILATPTDDNPANETAGVWFATPDTRAAALRLPELAPGWVFEGWIRTQDLAFTMGRFTRAQGFDTAGPTSGPRPGFETPGEDLVERLAPTLRQPVDLADGTSGVAISIEPDREGRDPTGPGMFTGAILRAAIPAGTAPLQPVALEVDTTLLPAGVASIG